MGQLCSGYKQNTFKMKLTLVFNYNDTMMYNRSRLVSCPSLLLSVSSAARSPARKSQVYTLYLYSTRKGSADTTFTSRSVTSKGLFTWREEDPSTRNFREGGKTFRLLYMRKFRPKLLPSGEGKRRITVGLEQLNARLPPCLFVFFCP